MTRMSPEACGEGPLHIQTHVATLDELSTDLQTVSKVTLSLTVVLQTHHVTLRSPSMIVALAFNLQAVSHQCNLP